MAEYVSSFPRSIAVFTPGTHRTPLPCCYQTPYKPPRPACMVLQMYQLAFALSTYPR